MLLAMLPQAVWAGVIKGKIVDDKGGKLPYATVYLEGTTTGTNANGDGYFELPVAPGLYKVICQYVGYKQASFNVSITGDQAVEHTFVLKEQASEMKEVVIHADAEDPAYEVIRKTIKKRKFHLDQVRSFQSSIYLKGIGRSRKMPDKFMGKKVTDETDIVDSVGKGILFLLEENADYYAEDDRKKTVIHSVRQSGAPNGLGFSQFPEVISFYENNISVFDNDSRGYISPVGDNALNYYKYKFMGQYMEQGHMIDKIQVTQKRAYEPCFNGTIYIVEDDWAIHSLDMTLTKQSGMDMLDTLTIRQLFLPLKQDTWVVKSQVLYLTIKLFGFDVTGNGVTVYNGQKVNEPIPDSIFADKVVSKYDKNARKQDTAYWAAARPIPLQQEEQRDFVAKDSLYKKVNSPEYRDSLRRRGNRFSVPGFLTSGSTFSGKDYRNTYTINAPLISLTTDNIFNYNLIEGFNIAPKLSWYHMIDTGKYLYGDMALRYGFSNKHFNAIGRLYTVRRDRSFVNRSWMYGVEGGKYVFQYDPDDPIMTWFNTYSALFFRQNDLKIYERSEGVAYLARNYGNGLSWYTRVSYQHRIPLENTTDYSVVSGNKDGFTPNIPPHLLNTATAWETNDAALFFASVSYKPGYTYTQLPDYKIANGSSWPRFTLTYDKGVPGIFNSVSNFDKWRFSILDEVKMRLLGVLKYNVAAGGFLNSQYVSVPDLMHLYGNRGIGYASPYLQSFQFAQYYQFSNKEPLYGEAHLEYHLRGLLSNKIPLLRQARWYLLFGGNAFYARQSDYYTEAFVGIDNIGWKLVRGLRIDLVQSWDSYGGRNSGIRFGLNLPGLQSAKNNPTKGEW
jgi:Family of unknown function (DUF5686)/CarboxypepD_reg-like domain